MSKAPETCLYCKGDGIGPGAPCGFCVNGKPLDTQEDWDNSWGKLGDFFESIKDPEKWKEFLQGLKDRRSE